MLSKFRYYTGIIFSAYTYGVGEPVAKGGRYDSLLGHFGKDEPAVGVGIYLDQLLSALTRQKITSDRGKNV
jgi:ATP phosphoribosyltransferase regulatory subunit